jgi:hypothetical protein
MSGGALLHETGERIPYLRCLLLSGGRSEREGGREGGSEEGREGGRKRSGKKMSQQTVYDWR